MGSDYIMRLVEQAGRMLASIIAHRKAGRDEEAGLEIEVKSRQTIGLPLELIRRCPPAALWELLQQSGGLCVSRAVFLAELLLQDAALSRDAGRSADSTASQLQAFCLLDTVLDRLSHEDAAIYLPKLESLATELEPAPHEPLFQQRLQRFRSRIRP